MRQRFEAMRGMADDELREWEVRLLRRDGSCRWVRTRAAAFARDAAGQVRQSEYAIDVSFASNADEECAWFMNLPTSFVLLPEVLGRRREMAGRLLRQSGQFEALLRLRRRKGLFEEWRDVLHRTRDVVVLRLAVFDAGLQTFEPVAPEPADAVLAQDIDRYRSAQGVRSAEQ